MDKDELNTIVLGEEEPLLPDGWKEGDDLFAEDKQDESRLLADERTTEADLLAEHKDEAPGQDGGNQTAETPGQDQNAGGAAEGEAKEPPDGEKTEQKPEEKPSRKLKLKVNHKEEVIDVDAMSDEELSALLQKGRAFDQRVEADNKRRFREVYQEQIDAGNTDKVARLVAKEEVGGKVYALKDEDETPAPAEQSPEPPAGAAPERDFRREIDQLKALYPDFKDLPQEVADAALKGVPVLNAYLAYRERQREKTVAAIQKENAVLKQNAASAAKAPVRGVTGGGDTHKAKDPFETGFDSVTW